MKVSTTFDIEPSDDRFVQCRLSAFNVYSEKQCSIFEFYDYNNQLQRL